MPTPSGVFLIDKPVGPSSRAALDAMERRLSMGAFGHTGTLDPLASGLLVVLAGSARRLQDLLMGSRKVYDAELTFGVTSETLDGEGPLSPTDRPVPLLDAALGPVLASLIGEVEQVPPAHSAIHVEGKRSYDLARKGSVPKLKPRRVRIDSINVLSAAESSARIRVTCGPGTYIRSLARDIGEAFGCGAYLSGLRRIRNGRFDVSDAVAPDAVGTNDLVTLSDVLAPFARIDVDRKIAFMLSLGQTAPELDVPKDEPAFAWHDGDPVCRLRKCDGGGRSDLRLREILGDAG